MFLKHLFFYMVLMFLNTLSLYIYAAPPPQTINILYLNSYHRGYSWSDNIEKGFLEHLKSVDQKSNVYIEYLDTKRFPDFNYAEQLATILKDKHSGIFYNVIVVSDNAAFDFAVKYRDQIFPNTPIVFSGYNLFRLGVLQGISNVTGLNEEANFVGTIEMALQVHPKTKQLVFLTSDFYPGDKRQQDILEQDLLPSYRHRFQITQLKNLHLKDIEQRLSSLPKDALVFIFGNPIDARQGNFIGIEEFHRRAAAASTVPAYAFWDFILNTGMMGGKIILGEEQGQMMAKLMLKILEGVSPDQIPVIMETPTTKVFDFNAMQRFKISEEDLPEGSVIINKPHTFYQTYKKYVWITVAIMVFLISLSFVLMFLLRKSYRLSKELQTENAIRQQAEQALIKHQEKLEEKVYERTLELQQLNQSLKEREALFHGMFDLHSAMMLLIDPNSGKIIEANQSALSYYGYLLEEFQQLTTEEIHQKMIYAEYQQCLHFEFLHTNGEIRNVEVHSSPIIWQGRQLLFSIVHDITERKQIDAELKERERELRELNDTKNRLFSIIAHDLKSPFNIILNFAEILVEDLQNKNYEECTEFAQKIYFSACNTYRLLNTLLDWARTQTNQVKMNLENINISIEIYNMLEDMRENAHNKQISLIYSEPSDVFIFGDKNMLNTVLRNLIANSIKYTPNAGQVEIFVKQQLDHAEISIRDNGVGMIKEIQEKLFISKVNQSTFGTNQEKGTGLGLVICHDFIKKMGGNIWVESELNHGSIFSFTIPIAPDLK